MTKIILQMNFDSQFVFFPGSRTNVRRGEYDVGVSNFNSEKEPHNDYDKELVAVCMRRFLYTRCYDSFQFLATLKVREASSHKSILLLPSHFVL